MTETQQRKVIELKPGVSLDSISDGDIIVCDGRSQLVTQINDVELQTMSRANLGIEVRQRWIGDYNPGLGYFNNIGTASTVVNNQNQVYQIRDQTLKEAGL
jgi:hypothetical protein